MFAHFNLTKDLIPVLQALPADHCLVLTDGFDVSKAYHIGDRLWFSRGLVTSEERGVPIRGSNVVIEPGVDLPLGFTRASDQQSAVSMLHFVSKDD